MTKTKIHIGCSGYNNAHWKGIFYPEGLPRTKWFDYYCQHFNTYEMNGTFYRFPTAKSLRNLYDSTPQGFLFSAKAPKTITHIKRFADCQAEIDAFYAICKENLQEKLGCILFQCPPSFKYDPQLLQLVISQLDATFPNAIEFRHESWWRPDVFKTLQDNGIIFCNVSFPGLPETVIRTARITYLRLHGNPKLFYSEYTKRQVKMFYDAVIDTKPQEAFVYFNNTASTAGILNALEMKEYL